jgi:RNA polymerase sigma-70 factor, ECF subfamily
VASDPVPVHITSGAEDQARRRDAQLVRRCRIGELGAWPELVDRFSRYVYAILTRGFELDPSTAEDVFQDVFMQLFRRLGTLTDDRAVRPWLAQLTRRAAINALRAQRREIGIDELPDVGEHDPRLELIEQAATVQRALAELPGPCREVVERFFIDDQSYHAIAKDLGLPPGTIASRISRGLAMLRDLLEGPVELAA